MIENNTYRLLWVDYMKGICMMAVIMSHIGWPEVYGKIFSPFFLTGFFFVSGYTFNRKNNFIQFLRGKIKTLVIPVLSLGSINALLAYWAENKPFVERIEGLLVQCPGMWDDLWFVVCLFSMEIMFYGITMLKSLKGISACVVALSLVGYGYSISKMESLPWHIENACILMIFLLGGYIVKNTKQGSCLLNLLKNYKVLLSLCLIYVLVVCLIDNYPIDIHLLNYNSWIAFMVTALMGVVIVLGVSLNLERFMHNPIMKYLQFVGQNTLVYYAFQSKAIRLIVLLLSLSGISADGYGSVLLYTLLVSIVLIAPSWLINKYFPFLIGKNIRL